jgi:hypothetical protein
MNPEPVDNYSGGAGTVGAACDEMDWLSMLKLEMFSANAHGTTQLEHNAVSPLKPEDMEECIEVTQPQTQSCSPVMCPTSSTKQAQVQVRKLPAPKPRPALAPYPGYQDRANVAEQDMKALNESQPLPGHKNNRIPFPYRLHEMLRRVHEQKRDTDLEHVVSWQPHGRAFLVHQCKHKVFVEQVLPTYFKQSKYTSFQRQLNLYGFRRLTGAGPDQGAYYHEYFLRHKDYLSDQIVRTKVKGTFTKPPMHPDMEPKLYSYPPVRDHPVPAPAPAGDSVTTNMKTSLSLSGTSQQEQTEIMSPVIKMISAHETVSTVTATSTVRMTPHTVTPPAAPRQVITAPGSNRDEMSLKMPCLDILPRSSFRHLSLKKNEHYQDGNRKKYTSPQHAFLISPNLSPVQEERLALGGEPRWQEDKKCPAADPAPAPQNKNEKEDEDDDIVLTFEGQAFHFLQPFYSMESFLKHQHKLGTTPAPITSTPMLAREGVLQSRQTQTSHWQVPISLNKMEPLD